MIFDGGREDWEATEVHDHRVGRVIAAVLGFLALCVAIGHAEDAPLNLRMEVDPGWARASGLSIYTDRKLDGSQPVPLRIPKGPPYTIDMHGDQIEPIHPAIEVEGSGNHCLLNFNGECIIKGDHLEIR